VLHLFLAMAEIAPYPPLTAGKVAHQVAAQEVAQPQSKVATVFLAQVVGLLQLAERQSPQHLECQHFQ